MPAFFAGRSTRLRKLFPWVGAGLDRPGGDAKIRLSPLLCEAAGQRQFRPVPTEALKSSQKPLHARDPPANARQKTTAFQRLTVFGMRFYLAYVGRGSLTYPFPTAKLSGSRYMRASAKALIAALPNDCAATSRPPDWRDDGGDIAHAAFVLAPLLITAARQRIGSPLCDPVCAHEKPGIGRTIFTVQDCGSAGSNVTCTAPAVDHRRRRVAAARRHSCASSRQASDGGEISFISGRGPAL